MPARIRLSLCLAAMAAVGCDCAGARLSVREQVDGGQAESFCGDGLLDLEREECDFGLESNVGGAAGSCTPECQLSRECPAGFRYEPSLISCVPVDPEAGADAGTADEDAGTVYAPDSGTFIEGTIWHDTPFVPDTVRPNLPIEGATATLRSANGVTTFTSMTTGPDGRYRFEVAAGTDYAVYFTAPSHFYGEADYRRLSPRMMPGQVAVIDFEYHLRGIHWRVSDAMGGAPLEGVEATIERNRQVIAGPLLTDVHGYVHLPNTAERGEIIFKKAGYRTYEHPSNDTRHQILGGNILFRAE